MLLLKLLVHLLLGFTVYTKLAAQCIHPPDAEDQKTRITKEIMSDLTQGRITYNIVEPYRINTHHNRYRHGQGAKYHPNIHVRRSAPIYGNSTCDGNRNGRGIHARSTCPWYVELEVDTQREPMVMAKAQCSCSSCQSVQGTRIPLSKCQPIYTYVPVIRWRCRIGRRSLSRDHQPRYFEYYKHLEEVPVGCTCTKRRHSS